MKFILAIAIALLITFAYVGDSTKAAVTYGWQYTGTNVYNEFGTIFYEFTGLEIGAEYRWDLYTVDPDTGQLLQSVDFNTLVPTTVTGTMYFGSPITGPIGPNDRTQVVPFDYQGPLAVVDSNGSILGRHFVASDPGLQADSDWFSGAGNTAIYDKQVIGRFDVTGFCENPAAAPLNADGWQHTFKPCSVATLSDDYAILHYQIDPTYVPTSDLRVIFFEIPTTDVEMTLYIDDILSYQTTASASVECACVYLSFMIVNTSGGYLPFVNNSIANAAFTTGDNPMTAEFPPGVYNYSRNDMAGWVADGESVWIVTDDPARNEWTLSGVGEVGVDGTQSLQAKAVTSEVWDSYHGYQLVADVDAGYSDTTIYTFAQTRNHIYTVGSSESTDVVAQWVNRASAINSGLATTTEMEFEVQFYYDIVTQRTFESSFAEVLNNAGLDNDPGRAIVLTIILFAGMIGVAGISGLGANIYAYLIVWTGLGATFILGGFGSLLVNTIFTIMTIGMWIFAMLIGGALSEDRDF